MTGWRSLVWLTTAHEPEQARDASLRPHPDCPSCSLGPCPRHSYSLMASVGTSRSPRSADDLRGSWRAVA